MFDNLRTYLLGKGAFTNEDLDLIESFATIKKLRKRQYLLQEGNVWKHVAFVSKGLLRSYFVDKKGVEHIMQFAPENYWTGDRESLVTGLPSRINIEAIEDSDIILFRNEDFQSLLSRIPSFNEFSIKLTNRNVLVLEERIYSNITLSAEEKYRRFLDQYPAIVSRVPQHMIASYLGVSPETISRIRSSAARK